MINKDSNHVTLAGQIYGEPHFEVVTPGQSHGVTPDGHRPSFSEVRFFVFVLKDREGRVAEKLRGKKTERSNGDLFRVVMQGPSAEVAYYYLKHAARVTVIGRLRKRYFSNKNKQKQSETEIIAESITPGFGADFERGERQRNQRADDASDRGLDLSEMGLQPVTVMLTEDELDEWVSEGRNSSNLPEADHGD